MLPDEGIERGKGHGLARLRLAGSYRDRPGAYRAGRARCLSYRSQMRDNVLQQQAGILKYHAGRQDQEPVQRASR